MPKQVAPSKYWVFTWNNYPELWKDMLLACPHIGRYIFGKEVGENGTPHIQGYMEFTKRVRPKTAIGIDAIHWETRRGTSQEAIDYCAKDGDFVKSPKVFITEPIRVISSLRPWQQDIEDMVNQRPDDRSIHWYWEEAGNVGKSAMVKYLVHVHGACMGAGKAADMKYAIVNFHQKNGVWPRIVLMDIPRSNLNYVSYTGIEEIKNGCFASSKYESDTVVMNSPHVICFANEPPNRETMSADRWKVHHLFK